MSIPENMNCCAYRPDPFIRSIPLDELKKKNESQLERFLDKVDANDDGKLSHKEMTAAADSNDDGKVSRSEKALMKDKLLEYMKDDNAIERMSPETLGKAQQMLEFLDDSDNHKLPPSLKDILKHLDKPLSPPVKEPFFPAPPFLPDAPGKLFIPKDIFDRIETPEDKYRV